MKNCQDSKVSFTADKTVFIIHEPEYAPIKHHFVTDTVKVSPYQDKIYSVNVKLNDEIKKVHNGVAALSEV